MAGLVALALGAWPGAAFGAEGSPPTVATGYGTIDLVSGSRDLTLTGFVNPNGSETTCQFELGPDEPEDRPGPYTHTAPCESAPGSGTSDVQVKATVAAADIPEGAAGHFRLVAGNAFGTTQGGDRPIGAVVCFCGGPLPKPSRPVVGSKSRVVNGELRVKIECRGGEAWCVGRFRLLTRVHRRLTGRVSEWEIGEGSYEVGPGQVKAVSFELRPWALRMLARSPERIRFVAAGSELGRQRVTIA